MNLRKTAKGRECTIRLPGCSFDPKETRLAHVRMAGITGGAQKAPDLLGAWACHHCSLATENGYETDDSVRLAFLHGVVRTQYALIREGVISW